MKIENSSYPISFASKIKLIPQKLFNEKIAKLNPKRHKVDYPWTSDTSKTGKNLFTNGIMDCICIAILGKSKTDLFHLCTYSHSEAVKKSQKGFNIKNIERRIMSKIDLKNEDLHAFILGGFQLEETSKRNGKQLNKIKRIFDKNEIPYSILGARKDVHYFGKFSMFYKNKEDTLYIANTLTESTGLNGQGKELVIDGENVIYHTYKKVWEDGLSKYQRKAHTGTAEDFLKTQFKDVSLCKFDEFV